MKKAEAKNKLEALIKQAQPLLEIKSNSQDFKKWHRKSEIAIEQIFSADTRHYQDFQDISYSLFAFTSNTPNSAFEDAYKEGILTAISILESFIDEIDEYWTEKPTQENEKRLMKNQDNQLTPPDKVTIPWLVTHIPIKLWLGSVVFIFGIYVLGVKSSQYSIVKEIFNLEEKSTEQADKKNKDTLLDKQTIEQSNYSEKMQSLYMELFIIENPNTMKKELDKALKKYSKKVLPYTLLYDYYIKTDDRESALIILNQAAENTVPSTLEEYEKLVGLLYENQLRPDLQKKYIKQAYINRTDDYKYKKYIEELYNKIIIK